MLKRRFSVELLNPVGCRNTWPGSISGDRADKVLMPICPSLFSSTNWTETQREKSFWTISSASCKKEVGCPRVRVWACECVFLLSQCKVCLSFTGMGGVSFFFFLCMTTALWSRSPLLVVPRLTRTYSCLGMDRLTCCLFTESVSARTLTHACLTVTQPPHSILIGVTHTESKYPADGSEHMG